MGGGGGRDHCGPSPAPSPHRFVFLAHLHLHLGCSAHLTSCISVQQLHCDLVPHTCENFLMHCRSGYYKGTVFHRCIKNFMIQVGTGQRPPFGAPS